MRVAELAEAAIHATILGLEVAAAATVVVGAVVGLWRLRQGMTAGRRAFGNAILLALDFTIGADLLKVSTVPDLKGLAVVGGVVLVRIALTILMVWEVKSELQGRPAKPRKDVKE